jgi:hypothetical protein
MYTFAVATSNCVQVKKKILEILHKERQNSNLKLIILDVPIVTIPNIKKSHKSNKSPITIMEKKDIIAILITKKIRVN